MKKTEAQTIAQLQAELQEARATIASQAEELRITKEQLVESREAANVRVNQEARAVSVRPVLVDVRQEAPPAGVRVFALGRGGVLIPTVWGKNEDGFFGAWMAYPSVPESVKEWLSQAWIKPAQ